MHQQRPSPASGGQQRRRRRTLSSDEAEETLRTATTTTPPLPKPKTEMSVTRYVLRYGIHCILGFALLWLGLVVRNHDSILHHDASTATPNDDTPPRSVHREEAAVADSIQERSPNDKDSRRRYPAAFDAVLERAIQKRDFCRAEQKDDFVGFDTRRQVLFGKQNQTLATLPAFGIIDALQSFNADKNADTNKEWQCELPPETECDETQLTAVFMAYNPERLGKTLAQIRKMLSRDNFQNLVKECVLVWNGERHIDESAEGKELLEFAEHNALRVVYPLRMGFPNDLMNRYHPQVLQITTAALLYYDDDGPFYSYKAIEAGFELWKRHPQAQIGAMSRQINYSARQVQERSKLRYRPHGSFVCRTLRQFARCCRVQFLLLCQLQCQHSLAVGVALTRQLLVLFVASRFGRSASICAGPSGPPGRYHGFHRRVAFGRTGSPRLLAAPQSGPQRRRHHDPGEFGLQGAEAIGGKTQRRRHWGHLLGLWSRHDGKETNMGRFAVPSHQYSDPILWEYQFRIHWLVRGYALLQPSKEGRQV